MLAIQVAVKMYSMGERLCFNMCSHVDCTDEGIQCIFAMAMQMINTYSYIKKCHNCAINVTLLDLPYTN